MSIKLYELAGADPHLRFSPYCWRTCMAFAHKGLQWEAIPWRFTDKVAIAPFGSQRVPVMLHDNQPVVDSWTIAQYLDEKFPDRPALFDSVGARSEGLLIKFWTERTVHPLISRMILSDIHAVLAEQDKAYFRETREKAFGTTLEALTINRDATRETFRAALEPLRATLGMQSYIGGAQPNYADYTVFGAFMWSRNSSPYELLKSDDPVYEWRARLLDAFNGLGAKSMSAG